MCTGAEIGLIASAAASTASAYNTNQVQRRENNAAVQALQDQQDIQQKANARVQQTVADTAKLDPRTFAQQRLQSYLATLDAARAHGDNTPPVGGQAFLDAQDATQAAVAAQGDKTAGLLSRLDAPALAVQQRGFDYAGLSDALAALAVKSKNDQYLAQLRMLRASQRDSGLDLASGLGQAYAGYQLSRAYPLTPQQHWVLADPP